MKDAMTYASEAGFFSFNVVGWRAEFERLIEAVRADVLAEQPASQEYQDHLVNQSFDWSAMAAKHQFMEGYRIGLAEMREKCAKVCDKEMDDWDYQSVVNVALNNCAAAIRAIKFEGDTGFRPVSEMIAEHKQDPKKGAAIEKAKVRKAARAEKIAMSGVYEVPVEQAEQEPAELKECRHCGFLCAPNPNESKRWYPLEQAGHEPFDMNDHPPHRLCECRKCMEYFTPLSDCDAYEQPVSQEPVIPAFLRRPGSFGHE